MHFKLFFLAFNLALVQGATLANSPAGKACAKRSRGLQYAAFKNPFARTDEQYSSFDPTYMKSTTAGGQGTANVLYNSTTSTGFFTSDGVDPSQGIHIYGSKNSIPDYGFAVNHRGYIKADIAGVYKIQINDIDDIALLWTGDTAKSGWTRDNAVAVGYYTSYGGNGVADYTVNMTPGEYLPIRVIWGNGGGPFSLNITIANSKGTTILGEDTTPTNMVVWRACGANKNDAPPFPNTFGNES
ncbi:GLEYA domain-containing protein [Neohortaea acidophila]|uniref:GLEYA domain-containing protein n=1 Tax=Neohortaea acidophila TaxID=245834 RepID=A0A6A6Q1W3_9PEZI|nr:GLEYA domain-containing protein [Neohortaea acidophila]KAF2485427.1 GLEYA domain-containing protein [Neohortaea acidophila]